MSCVGLASRASQLTRESSKTVNFIMFSEVVEQLNNRVIPWNKLNQLHGSVSDDEYLTICKLLCDLLTPLTFDKSANENTFDDVFLRGDRRVFIYLLAAFSEETKESFKQTKLMSIIYKKIYNAQHLGNLLLDECKLRKLDESSERLLTTLVSIPQIISNVAKLKTPKPLTSDCYFQRLCTVIMISLEKIYVEVKNDKEVSLEFMSQLLGRICVCGQAEVVYTHILKPTVLKCEEDFVWRRISFRMLVSTQKPINFEKLMRPIFANASSPAEIVSLIGNAIDQNKSLEYLLTQKFLLIASFSSGQSAKNVMGYLAAVDRPNFMKALKNSLAAWSSPSSLKHRSITQNLFISALIYVSTDLMREFGSLGEVTDIIVYARQGIELYIKTSQSDVRSVGLFVGQHLLKTIEPNGPKLDFELEKDAGVVAFLKFVNKTNTGQEVKGQTPADEAKIPEKTPNQGKSKKSLIEVVGEDTDDAYEEELKAFGKPEGYVEPPAKKPLYLRDCMQGLGDSEDPEWTLSCLESVESLVTSNPFAAKEIATELTNILLAMQNQCDVSEFDGWKMRGLVAICVSSPEEVANFLTKQFYTKISIAQRLDILQVLMLGSQQLANPQKAVRLDSLDMESFLVPKVAQEAEAQWQTVVRDRIAQNTRKLTSKPKTVTARANGFVPHAPSFFFPLLDRFDGLDVIYNLKGEDHYILGRLVYTLGMLLHAASQAPVAKKMGKRYIQFLWAFRYHVEP